MLCVNCSLPCGAKGVYSVDKVDSGEDLLKIVKHSKYRNETSHIFGIFPYIVDGYQSMHSRVGIGVTNTGHCHPTVVNAICTQAETLMHGQVNLGYAHDMNYETVRVMWVRGIA